jgi:hypothetical protein
MADVKLFGRQIRVVVSTIEIRDLDMAFHVKKSLKPEPNTADLAIMNLNPDHRSALEQMKIAPVMIEAGYLGGVSTLFLGDLRTATTTHEGPDYITRLGSGDGEKKVKKARINTSLKKGVATPAKVLEAVAKSLGVGEGNLSQAIAQIQSAGIANHFAEGAVISGSSFRQMNDICRSVGVTWSIQDGKLQILPLRTALEGQAVVISERTGMVGAPTVDNDGVLSVKVLLIPDVFPGRKIVLEGERLKGQYRIESCSYSGDTHSEDWYIDIEAKRY